jgi:hypothetical protein
MATGYIGSWRSIKTYNSNGSNGFQFKIPSCTDTSKSYNLYCTELAGCAYNADGWYSNPIYRTSGDYYAKNGIAGGYYRLGSISSFTYWTVTTQDAFPDGDKAKAFVFDLSENVNALTTNDEAALCMITDDRSDDMYFVRAIEEL